MKNRMMLSIVALMLTAAMLIGCGSGNGKVFTMEEGSATITVTADNKEDEVKSLSVEMVGPYDEGMTKEDANQLKEMMAPMLKQLKVEFDLKAGDDKITMSYKLMAENFTAEALSSMFFGGEVTADDVAKYKSLKSLTEILTQKGFKEGK